MAQQVAHPPGVGNLMGSMLGQNRVIDKDIKNCTYYYYVRRAKSKVKEGRKPWTQSGTTQYHAQLGLPDNGRTIKGLIMCNSWDIEPLEFSNPTLKCFTCFIFNKNF